MLFDIFMRYALLLSGFSWFMVYKGTHFGYFRYIYAVKVQSHYGFFMFKLIFAEFIRFYIDLKLLLGVLCAMHHVYTSFTKFQDLRCSHTMHIMHYLAEFWCFFRFFSNLMPFSVLFNIFSV